MMKESLGIILFMLFTFVTAVYFIEYHDYVETAYGSINAKDRTIEVRAHVNIDGSRVKTFTKTVDYCDKQAERKLIKAVAKTELKKFKGNCK